MSVIADVARLAGVSKSTASRALSGNGYVSEQTRARVKNAAAEIAYIPSSIASSLATGHTRNIGVVIPFVNRWFFAEVLEGIESALISADYDLTLYRLHDDAVRRQRVFDYFLARKRVDAVIAVAISLSAYEVQSLNALGKPIVGIGGDIPEISTLSIDDTGASRFLTEHLISLGHTRIMHLGGDPNEQMDFAVHTQRLDGFRKALAAAGLSHNNDFRAVAYSIPGGHSGALAALSDPSTRPTAIVAGCDEIAIGVMLAARELGISVPAQLSVVGIDGHDLAELFGLTTLEQHPSIQGERAVQLILSRLGPGAGVLANERIGIPVDFVVRRSTTAPPRPH
ncbi:LacI family DNA-binding transcriptional regulator [Frigoribacterium sp. CG_9.8]|uniref:LacI family DNA-binding transcriptional regulator n=1 Tax=Frigoribacterium sp. CG_9.8 TaxID=2787733 RepID=UPI0018CA96E2|nr:DNA-binding LacI/PurR family transcriptional regulator [Frigoribacterium sp. CG_9.8]